MSVMVRHLIELGYQSTLYTLMSIIKKVDKVKGCLIYSLLEYAITLTDLKVGAIISEYAITQIDSNDLWIDEDRIQLVTIVANYFESYFSNPKSVALILSKFPHIDHSSIRIITGDTGINPGITYNTNLNTLSKKIVNIKGNKTTHYFRELINVLQDGCNYIVDGRNMFFDTAVKGDDKKARSNPDVDYLWKDKHMININKLDSFIHLYKEHHLVIVFYHKHATILSEIVEKYRTRTLPTSMLILSSPNLVLTMIKLLCIYG